MRTRRLVFIVVILIALAAAVCVGSGQLAAILVGKKEPSQISPEATTQAPLVRAQGEVEPVRWVELGFANPGIVAEVLVVPGQIVAGGEVLARLDTTQLELAVRAARDVVAVQEAGLARLLEPPNAQAIAAAQAEAEAAQALLAALEAGPSAAEIAAAKADVAGAQAELARLNSLPDPSSMAQAQAQLDKATVALQQAQAAYDQIKDYPNAGLMGQALMLQQATIDYNAARAALDLAARKATTAELRASQARLASAQARLAQIAAGPSQADMAAARSRLRNAEAALAKAQEGASKADMAAAEANVAQAQTHLAQTQADLQLSTIHSPFAGTITAVDAEPGERVGNMPILTLADLDTWQVRAIDLDEWAVARIHLGQAVELTFPAFDRKALTGQVAFIPLRGEQTSGSSPFYPVIVSLDEPNDGDLRWGMTARLVFGEEQ